jgi:hypothetical protein
MTTGETTRSILNILRRGAQLRLESAARTSDVNEAYLYVHDAVALALDRNARAMASSAQAKDDQSGGESLHHNIAL